MNAAQQDEILEIFLDHYQNPHHYGPLQGADLIYEGGNPGCGDLVTVYLKVKDNRLEEFSFTGQGCTISQAATSILSDLVLLHPLDDILVCDHHLLSAAIGEEWINARPLCTMLGHETLKAAITEWQLNKKNSRKLLPCYLKMKQTP